MATITTGQEIIDQKALSKALEAFKNAQFERNVKNGVKKPRKWACIDADELEDFLYHFNLLEILAKDSNWRVRRKVANNPNTPTEILIELGSQFPEEYRLRP